MTKEKDIKFVTLLVGFGLLFPFLFFLMYLFQTNYYDMLPDISFCFPFCFLVIVCYMLRLQNLILGLMTYG